MDAESDGEHGQSYKRPGNRQAWESTGRKSDGYEHQCGQEQVHDERRHRRETDGRDGFTSLRAISLKVPKIGRHSAESGQCDPVGAGGGELRSGRSPEWQLAAGRGANRDGRAEIGRRREHGSDRHQRRVRLRQ